MAQAERSDPEISTCENEYGVVVAARDPTQRSNHAALEESSLRAGSFIHVAG